MQTQRVLYMDLRILSLALLLACCTATAQQYPTRPVRLIAPFAPGGGLDATARIIAQRLNNSWGQPVVVDNRPAVDGIVGTETVARASPDGYTLLIVNMSHAINPALGRKLPYDTLRDFAPITQTHLQQLLLVVIPSVPAKSVKELVDLLKAKPDALSYGASSSAAALPMELFKSMTGTRMTQIPYKGTGPMLNDLLGGQIQITLGAATPILPHVQSGRLRALANGDSKRSPALGDVPTIAESGVPGYHAVMWNGLLAPAHTPRVLIERLNKDITGILRSPDVQERMERFGNDIVASRPDEWQRFIETEIAKWTKIARLTGIKAE